ncbi:glycoside hydrolase [Coccomyxa subellipsoidea C-169]|uniref:mannan endo-1,4-beta-mannosidase n=1 Tax=Coccomyxa subellipsoidea (strain C-169) TaxID=574566 RepID=I0YSH7_COCSC|nr:glycoside hydrolase [Coccomyxa subellipsoidea C-169]EIE21346.1 glycoside hydrolase [Coccomyxa subellipsoidea C-169]|eukprot:XP_005645890.1 glycoside hydrolase [Coccomyxa subellipsoidea C-169]
MRSDKYTLPSQPTDDSFAPLENRELAAKVESGGNVGFVGTNGTNFVLNGKITYFSGSNDYFLILRTYLSDDQVRLFFRVMAGNGIDLIRTWGFLNGQDDPYTAGVSIQPSIGVFNEQSLQRLDLIFAEANSNGVRIILPFVNFWADLGGMQWYVTQLLGPGHALDEFYTDTTVKQAYKNYVKKIVTRVNTITGVAYINDPTVFAWELANEPHCTDGYEDSLGVPHASIVRAWVAEMAAYIRSLDPGHMIATGEEGFISTGGPNSGWRNDGTKGVDFALNLQDPNIDFGTVHVYPGSWGIPADNVAEFANSFIYSRAQIANAIGKPFILEETGMDVNAYPLYRPDFYTYLFSAAQRSDAKAMMPWELVAWHVDARDSGGYDFGIDDVSFGPVSAAIAYQKNRTIACASGVCPPVTPPCTCFDVPPSSDFTCPQQAGFYQGNCSKVNFLGNGICDLSCGRCSRCADYDYCKSCTDKAPSLDYTCKEQAGFYQGNCSAVSFLGPGTCDASCGRCSLCPATSGPPKCQINIAVGPVWPAGGTQQGTKMQIYLSSPANNTIVAPYTVTLTSPAPYSAAYPWEWQATITPEGLTGLVTGTYDTLRPFGGNTANIGTIVFFSDPAALKPTSASINNQTCGLTVSTYYEPLG